MISAKLFQRLGALCQDLSLNLLWHCYCSFLIRYMLFLLVILTHTDFRFVLWLTTNCIIPCFFARFVCNSLFTLFIAEFILSFIWTSVELFLFSIMIHELMRIVTKVLRICEATVVYFFVLQEIKQNPV